MTEFETKTLVEHLIQIIAVIVMIAIVVFFVTNLLGG